MAYGNVESSDTPFGSTMGRRTAGPILPVPADPDWIWRDLDRLLDGGCTTSPTNVPGVTVIDCRPLVDRARRPAWGVDTPTFGRTTDLHY